MGLNAYIHGSVFKARASDFRVEARRILICKVILDTTRRGTGTKRTGAGDDLGNSVAVQVQNVGVAENVKRNGE